MGSLCIIKSIPEEEEIKSSEIIPINGENVKRSELLKNSQIYEVNDSKFLKNSQNHESKNEKPEGREISLENFKKKIPKEYLEDLQKNPYEEREENKNHKKFPPIEITKKKIYHGEWNNNLKMSGQGELFFPKENVFVKGNWKDGIFYKGRIYGKDMIYEGEIKNNQYNGYGKLIDTKKNEIYEGNFKNNQKHGEGVLTFGDKSKYIGNFENDEFSEGELKWINGDYYKGNFKDGIFNGEGNIKIKNGSEYEGNFLNGLYNGKGVFKWKNGDSYDGHYSYGIKEGKGKYTFNNKNSYDGQWYSNKPHGEGTLTINNHSYQINFRNGKLVQLMPIKKNFNFDNDPALESGEIPELPDLKWNFEDIDFFKLKFINVSLIQKSIFSKNKELKSKEEFVEPIFQVI